jgi:hypothetical protein
LFQVASVISLTKPAAFSGVTTIGTISSCGTQIGFPVNAETFLKTSVLLSVDMVLKASDLSALMLELLSPLLRSSSVSSIPKSPLARFLKKSQYLRYFVAPFKYRFEKRIRSENGEAPDSAPVS